MTRHRKSARWVGVLVLGSALTLAGAAHAEAEADLAAAENAYAALDYAKALASAEAVLAEGGLSHDVLTRATRVAALSHAALGHADKAKEQFILMLEYDPDFKVDAKLGPRFAEPFAEARGYWQAQGRQAGMDVQLVLQWGQPGEIRISTRDPLGIVKRLSTGHRWAPQREYVTVELDGAAKTVDVAANPESASRLEYFVRALDANGNAVFERGTPSMPEFSVVSEPARAQAQESKRSFFTSPVFLIIGGGVLAAAAVGGYFALRPTDYQAPSTGRAVFGASCGAGVRCD